MFKRVKLKLKWRPQEVRGARNMELLLGKLQSASRASPRKPPWGCIQQSHQKWGFQSPLELTYYHYVPQILDMELHGFVFPAGFGLALVQFLFTVSLFFPFGMVIVTLYHCVLEVCYFIFYFDSGPQLRVCLESQRKLWIWTLQYCWNTEGFGDYWRWTEMDMSQKWTTVV